MKVIATARGYFDQIREPGDEFEVPDDTKAATWFDPVEKQADKPATSGRGRSTSTGKPGSTDDLA